MSRAKKDPFLEILTYLRTAPDAELKHIAAQAAVELKARQPGGPEVPRPRKTRKPGDTVVPQEV